MKIKPIHLYYIGAVIIILPFVKMWIEEFLKHPFGMSGITGTIFILASFTYSMIYEDKHDKDKKDRSD
jgi:hypothetical protein